MGRHRKYPVEGGGVEKESSSRVPKDVVEFPQDRLGLNDNVCQDCNARNGNRETCRKCGSSNLRKKKKQFADA